MPSKEFALWRAGKLNGVYVGESPDGELGVLSKHTFEYRWTALPDLSSDLSGKIVSTAIELHHAENLPYVITGYVESLRTRLDKLMAGN